MASPFQSSRSSRAFDAGFPGVCSNCEEGFEAGELIMYEGDDLVHAEPDECMRFHDRPVRKPCGKCFLMHAGDCF